MINNNLYKFINFMELKLSKERFDEIAKLIEENPKKANREIKKEELLDFIHDSMAQSKTDLEEVRVKFEQAKKDLSKAEESNNLLTAQLKETRSLLAEGESEKEALQTNFDELEETVSDAEDVLENNRENYEVVLQKLTHCRLLAIILAAIVVLQWIL